VHRIPARLTGIGSAQIGRVDGLVCQITGVMGSVDGLTLLMVCQQRFGMGQGFARLCLQQRGLMTGASPVTGLQLASGLGDGGFRSALLSGENGSRQDSGDQQRRKSHAGCQQR
jgi:hypothetical protein